MIRQALLLAKGVSSPSCCFVTWEQETEAEQGMRVEQSEALGH